MINRPRKHLLIPLLAMSLTRAITASVPAQGHGATAQTFQVSFGTTPQWVAIPNTHVEGVREGQRLNFDMFRYNRNYYVYSNNQWYRSGQESGQFAVIADHSVPTELRQVPTGYWHYYPSSWQTPNYQNYPGSSPPPKILQISFASAPQWVAIPNSRVREIREGERPSYDMFRYGHSYYVYQNNRWYVGRHWRGQFTLIDERYVPSELRQVPSAKWRHYPSGWLNKDNNPPSNSNAQGQSKDDNGKVNTKGNNGKSQTKGNNGKSQTNANNAQGQNGGGNK